MIALYGATILTLRSDHARLPIEQLQLQLQWRGTPRCRSVLR